VWDYVGDGYVHRLIQSKTDGKLVELPAPCRDGNDDCCNCGSDDQGMESALYNSKVDAVAAEYDLILTIQLDSQRQYYEGKIVEMEEEKALAIQQAVDESVSLKMRKLQVRLENMEKETRDLRELNKCLIENQKVYQQRIKEFEEREKNSVKERDEKIADLEEQVRDFMFMIEAQKVLETRGNGAELRDGSVLALPANLAPSKSSSRTVRQGKKKK
jgi:BRCA1-associated protein